MARSLLEEELFDVLELVGLGESGRGLGELLDELLYVYVLLG